MFDAQNVFGPPHHGPLPYGPPPRRPSSTRLVAAVFGVVALAGMLCTLLPLWTITTDPATFGPYGVTNEPTLGGTVRLHVGFYDWITSSAPVFALIPLALAVGVGVGAIQLVRNADRVLWGAAAGLAFAALVLSASVAIKPSSAVEVTGPLARRLGPGDLSLNQTSALDVSYGPGLIIAVAALVVMCGLAGWQYVATRPE